MFKKVGNFFGYGGVFECRRNELARAVGFVAAREAAGERDYVRALNRPDYRLYALLDVLRSAVADYQNFGIGARESELALGVELAVGAGERGNEHAGFCRLYGDSRIFARLFAVAVGNVALGGSRCGEHAVEFRGVCRERFGVTDIFTAAYEAALCRFADIYGVGAEERYVVGAHDYVAVALFKQLVCGKGKAETEPVAEAAFCRGGGDAALFYNGCMFDYTRTYARMNGCIQLFEVPEIGHGICILLHGKEPHFFARAFGNVGYETGSLCGGERKGYERGRHVDILERAAHRVFAADCRKP